MDITAKKLCGGVALLIFLVVAKEALAIKCWDCRSDADPKCSDPFDNTTFAITDCDQRQLDWLAGSKSTMCRKMRQKLNGVWLYVRSCAFLGEVGIGGDERFCLMRTGTYNIFMEYCTCNSKDGCNGAATVSSSVVTLILSSTLILVPFLFRNVS